MSVRLLLVKSALPLMLMRVPMAWLMLPFRLFRLPLICRLAWFTSSVPWLVTEPRRMVLALSPMVSLPPLPTMWLDTELPLATNSPARISVLPV